MSDTQKQSVEKLNALIETTTNAREGYRTAASKAKQPELRTFFNTCAQARANFIAELESTVRELGGTPETGGTLAGKAHRGWIKARSSFGDTDQSVLSECERGEKHAVEEYEDALSAALPHNVKQTLNEQLNKVQNDLRRIQELEAVKS